jgi:hypothetical protein
MADNWTQGSFAFRCTAAEYALIEEAASAGYALANGDPPEPPSVALLAAFPPGDESDLWSGFRTADRSLGERVRTASLNQYGDVFGIEIRHADQADDPHVGIISDRFGNHVRADRREVGIGEPGRVATPQAAIAARFSCSL